MNFEESFKQLEEILTQMNGGELSLDQSLAQYEKADVLIQNCQKQLKDAEQKIEQLTKNRDQSLSLDEKGQPQVQAFEPSCSNETP